jgi:uncharacterized membrane protein
MRSFAFIVCLSAAIWAASSDSSRAEFRVCNSSGSDVRIAFGNHDSRYGWTSRGWWTLADGSCQGVLYGDVERGNYYVYAIDRSNRSLAVPDSQSGGSFCVKDTAFDLRSSGFMTPQNTLGCEAQGVKSARFRAIEVASTVADYTYTLPAGATNTPSPNVASTPSPGVAGMSSPGVAAAGAIAPIIKDAVQNLPRPAPPTVAAPAPAPVAVAQTPAQPAPAQRPQASGTACQRYPNLC